MERQVRATIFRDESHERPRRHLRAARGERANPVARVPPPPRSRPGPPLPIHSPARPAILVPAPPHPSPRLRGVRVPPSFPKPRFPLPPAARNQKNSGACCGPQPHVGAGPVPPSSALLSGAGIGRQESGSVEEMSWKRGWELAYGATNVHK